MKILKLLNLLKNYTDENHHLNANEIIGLLSKENISINRKTIYEYITILNNNGYNIILDNTRSGYYLANDISECEAKILADALNSTNFISKKQTTNIINKLLANHSTYEKADIIRSIYDNTAKTCDNSILYTIDTIQKAINQNLAISFNYVDTTFKNKRHYRLINNKIHQYTRIPITLVLFNQYYYLIAYSPSHDNYSHFRVDKIVNIHTSIHNTALPPFDLSNYVQQHFNMNVGKKENITISFTNDLEFIVYDKLKDQALLLNRDDKQFTINFDAIISEDLIGWIISFRNKAKIIQPQSLIDEIINTNKTIIELYKGDQNEQN